MQRSGALTLSHAVFRHTTLGMDAILVLLGSAVVALTAQVTIPLQPVPITGQTFGVLLVGTVLGSKRGALALILYIAEGLRFPVFQGGNSAWTLDGLGAVHLRRHRRVPHRFRPGRVRGWAGWLSVGAWTARCGARPCYC
jgi:hypothetical protein